MSNKIPITGFSLARPWPWAMLTTTPSRPPLRLVYSTWPLPAERFETYVALHANIQWEANSAAHLAQALGLEVPGQTTDAQPFNVIFAVAQWVACVTEFSDLPLRQRPWFAQCHHWVLGRFTVIEPVPCLPGGNFFRLPTNVLQTVRSNYRKALNF